MGCWGITALESDNGLDAVRCVRYNLPADGQLDLGEMLERLKKDRWNAPCDVKLGCAHTSPMALAEIVVKYLDGDPGSLDYDEEWAAEDNKFRSVTSFTASRASLRELRDYLADTLKYARIRAERQIKAGERTQASYAYMSERIHAALGHLYMDKITPRQIQKFINSLSEPGANQTKDGKGLSPKSVKNFLSMISAVFVYAIKMGMLQYNPCRAVTLPPLDTGKEKQCYTPWRRLRRSWTRL